MRIILGDSSQRGSAEHHVSFLSGLHAFAGRPRGFSGCVQRSLMLSSPPDAETAVADAGLPYAG